MPYLTCHHQHAITNMPCLTCHNYHAITPCHISYGTVVIACSFVVQPAQLDTSTLGTRPGLVLGPSLVNRNSRKEKMRTRMPPAHTPTHGDESACLRTCLRSRPCAGYTNAYTHVYTHVCMKICAHVHCQSCLQPSL